MYSVNAGKAPFSPTFSVCDRRERGSSKENGRTVCCSIGTKPTSGTRQGRDTCMKVDPTRSRADSGRDTTRRATRTQYTSSTDDFPLCDKNTANLAVTSLASDRGVSASCVRDFPRPLCAVMTSERDTESKKTPTSSATG